MVFKQPRMTKEWEQIFTLLSDPAVSEMESNGKDLFFIKKKGKRYHLREISFPTEEAYVQGIEESLIPFVRHFREKDEGDVPWNNDYLFEGPLEIRFNDVRIKGRTHITLPPVADTPQITIAKKSTSLITLDAIAERGSMSLEMKQFLEASVRARMTTVFSGGTGAGKTTMLEAMSKYIPMDTRIGVAEDTPELELLQLNTSYLHSVPHRPGLDPNKVASLDWCVAQFNRMRTDLLIIGETRGKEFASFLVAANSGMEGCLTTIHSNTPTRCLEKMSNFALKGSERQPVRAVNSDIANSLDLIVQLIILPNGLHKVASITEVTNTLSNDENATITTNMLYEYDPLNDVFIKKAYAQDKLREVWAHRGVDMTPFLQTAYGAVMKPHGGGSSPSGTSASPSPTSGGRGLPVPGGSRTL